MTEFSFRRYQRVVIFAILMSIAVYLIGTLIGCGDGKIDCEAYAEAKARRARKQHLDKFGGETSRTITHRLGAVYTETIKSPEEVYDDVYKSALLDCREENIWRAK